MIQYMLLKAYSDLSGKRSRGQQMENQINLKSYCSNLVGGIMMLAQYR